MKEINTLIILSNQNLLAKTGAAYSRILCYAKAIASNSNTRVLLCSFQLPKDLHYSEEIANNIHVIGVKKDYSSSKYRKYLYKILYPFYTIHYYINLNKNYHNISVTWLIFSIKIFYDIISLFFIRCLRHEKVFCEKNELISGLVKNQTRNYRSVGGLYSVIFYPLLYISAKLVDRIIKYYSGVIAISTKMQLYANKFNNTVIRIPPLIDFSAMTNNPESTNQVERFSICFAGGSLTKKEGIDILLKALSIVKAETDNFVMNIYGSGDKYSERSIRSQIESCGLREYVNLNGVVSSAELFKVFQRHDLLIMTRPSNTQTEYGLSTKLAEYMASGTAVMVTDVSDNRLFIQDGVNGFIVEPGNIDDIVNKLMKILNNEYDLKSIGERGRETALKYFDYKNYAEILNKFVFE